MVKGRLGISFFEGKTTLDIARELLGKVLVFETPRGVIRGIINETEAYTQEDESSHSYGGRRTKRNEVMFKRGGHFYVYFTYGMYHCCNIVTAQDGIGEAVLIRSVVPIEGVEIMRENRGAKIKDKDLTNGPGKVCMAYGVGKEFNGLDLLEKNSKLYLEEREFLPVEVITTKRIGISRAKDLEWRFYSPRVVYIGE